MAVGKAWPIAVPITKNGGTYGYITVYFQEEYDSLGNYSGLKVIKMTGSNSIRAGGFHSAGSIAIDGTVWYSWNANDWIFSGLAGECEFSTYSGATYPSGLRIDHEEDGSKTINISVQVSYYYGYDADWSGNGGTVTEAVALTPIPRASTITATDANIGAASFIAVNRKSAVYSHSVRYEFGTESGWLNADGSISATEVKFTETAIGWTIPESFYTQIPDAKNGQCTLTITTYADDLQIGDARTFAFTVTAAESLCAPVVIGTAVDINETTLALTGDENSLIRFFSNVLATISVQPQNGATIVSKSIQGHAVDLSADSMTFESVETGSFVFAATDSRGYTTTITVVKTLIPYSKLSCAIDVARDDPTSGKATLIIKGSYFNDTFGAVDNALTVLYRTPYDDAYSTAEVTIAGNTYAAVVALTGLDYKKTHLIEVIALDKLMEVPKDDELGKGIPDFHMGEHDVAFEVLVQLKNGFTILGKTMLDFFYPIGRILVTDDEASPADLYGGTWEQLEDINGHHAWKRVEDGSETNAVAGLAIAGLAVAGKG